MGTFFIVLVMSIGATAYVAYRLIRITQGIGVLQREFEAVPRRTRTDISERQIYIPDQLKLIADQLTAMQFERLGEIEIYYPDREFTQRLWLMVDPPRTTCAALMLAANYGPLLTMETYLQNQGHVETMGVHPKGAFVHALHDSHWRNVEASSQETETAYREHLNHVTQVSSAHGNPIAIPNIEEYIGHLKQAQPRYKRGYTLLIQHYRHYQYADTIALIGIGLQTLYLVGRFFTILPFTREILYGCLSLIAVGIAYSTFYSFRTRRFNRSVTRLGAISRG